MLVKRICAWCKSELPTTNEGAAIDGAITHGICDDCAQALSAAPRKTAGQFLESLSEPVFLLGAGGRIVSANSAARSVVGKELTAIEDRLNGDVFECVNADLPGGCGNTEHCKACIIRNTVNETIATGKGVVRTPAHQDVKTADGVQTKRYLISTERVAEFVLLRIDAVP
jgi:hypothetical protein